MNASRRVLRASTNTAKSLYDFGEKTIQGHLIEGSIIIILIILTAVVLKFLPLKFLCFFNNIIVKNLSYSYENKKTQKNYNIFSNLIYKYE